MKNIKLTKRVVSLTACLAMLGGLGAIDASAKEHNISYSFKIKPEKERSHDDDSRYRETTNENNKWKNKFSWSSEGAGTVTKFCISKESTHKEVSNVIPMNQGGLYYNPAKAAASKSWVVLSGENNNSSASSYTVSGYWDEEIN